MNNKVNHDETRIDYYSPKGRGFTTNGKPVYHAW